MKKKKAKKAGGKKEEKTDSGAWKNTETTELTTETSAEVPAEVPVEVPTEPPSASPDTTIEEQKEEEISAEIPEDKDEEEKVSDPDSSARHGRSPSLSLQSKMRSSSFRQASGALSPEIAFGPSGDTAPDIHRKQALRIEDLERENKRLSKEAGDSEKRWKKAEEELEDLREAEGESKGEKSIDTGSSEEVEKLVSAGELLEKYHGKNPELIESCRSRTLQPFNDKIHNFRFRPRESMYHHLRPRYHHLIWKPSYVLNHRQLSLWKLKFPTFGHSLNVSHQDHLWKRNKSQLSRINWQEVKNRLRMRNVNWEISKRISSEPPRKLSRKAANAYPPKQNYVLWKGKRRRLRHIVMYFRRKWMRLRRKSLH